MGGGYILHYSRTQRDSYLFCMRGVYYNIQDFKETFIQCDRGVYYIIKELKDTYSMEDGVYYIISSNEQLLL